MIPEKQRSVVTNYGGRHRSNMPSRAQCAFLGAFAQKFLCDRGTHWALKIFACMRLANKRETTRGGPRCYLNQDDVITYCRNRDNTTWSCCLANRLQTIPSSYSALTFTTNLQDSRRRSKFLQGCAVRKLFPRHSIHLKLQYVRVQSMSLCKLQRSSFMWRPDSRHRPSIERQKNTHSPGYSYVADNGRSRSGHGYVLYESKHTGTHTP